MADTGAPWNIPYIEPTDLVRNYPAAAEDLADAIAAGLTAAGNPGIGSNVVQTVKTDAFSTSSTTFVDITGLTLTITPSSATSKVLVFGDIMIGSSTRTYVQLMRGATAIRVGVGAAGSRVNTGTAGNAGFDGANSGTNANAGTMVFLDSPGSASAVTYKMQMRVGTAGTGTLNEVQNNLNNANFFRAASSITAIEVAA